MAVQVSVDWPTCDEDGCIGLRLDAGDNVWPMREIRSGMPRSNRLLRPARSTHAA